MFRQDGKNNAEQGYAIRTACHMFSADGTQCDSPGQRPGKMRNECPKPQRGEMTMHSHDALSGLRGSKLQFPGAMPQAFTFCRVAARPFELAIRGEGTRTESTVYLSQIAGRSFQVHSITGIHERTQKCGCALTPLGSGACLCHNPIQLFRCRS